MIGKLQRNFIILAMLATIFVTGTIFGVITIENFKTVNNQIDGILRIISENDGKMPEYQPRNDELAYIITKETQFSTRYFTIKLNNNNEIIETNMDYIASITGEQAQEFLKDVINSNKTTGYYKQYKYSITNKDYGKLIVFLNASTQLRTFKRSTKQAIIVIFIGLSIVFIVLSILSKRILNPIIESIEKQKQFITNAGHELKTPVAVIMANSEVLEMISNEDSKEWITSIKTQAKKLDTLIKSLLSLSNFEERNITANYTEFIITDVIKEQISEIKALAQNKEIVFETKEETKITADINTVKQLITIFLDNAIKYTPENGKIIVKLEKARKKCKTTISK